jgi:type II secretory pathway component PulJ
MKRALPLLALLITTGCAARVTDRLDALNQNLGHLSAQLDEANARLAAIEKDVRRLAGEGNSSPAPPDKR